MPIVAFTVLFSAKRVLLKVILVGALLNINTTFAVALPPELEPVIVYVTEPVTCAVNVPLIIPVVGLIVKPAGNDGLMV